MQVVLVLVGSKWFKRWRLVGRLIFAGEFLSCPFLWAYNSDGSNPFCLGSVAWIEDDFKIGEQVWRTRPCGTEENAASLSILYKFELWKHPIVNASSRINSIVLQWFIHLQRKLLRQTLVVTAVQDWVTCHHCGLPTTTRFLQATLLSTSIPYPSFCLGFGTTFYAQNSDLVTWSWRSTLL